MKNPSKWWDDALCKGLDANIFFPERPQGRDYFAVARSYCKNCEVRTACLEEALSYDADTDRFGMFGGLTPKERARLRQEKPEVAIVSIRPVKQPRPVPAIVPKEATIEVPSPRRIIRAYMARNLPRWDELALKRKPIKLEKTDIPKQTRLVMDVTPTMGASTLTAQASAAMTMAGWEDPMSARTAAALFMGASYVGDLARRGVESGILTPQENAAVQGVVELAMQVWKYHAVTAKIEPTGAL